MDLFNLCYLLVAMQPKEMTGPHLESVSAYVNIECKHNRRANIVGCSNLCRIFDGMIILQSAATFLLTKQKSLLKYTLARYADFSLNVNPLASPHRKSSLE